jgi:hypothetical protein
MASIKLDPTNFLQHVYGKSVVGLGDEELVCADIAALLMDGTPVIRVDRLDFFAIDPTPRNIRRLHMLGFVDYQVDHMMDEILFKLNQRALDYLQQCR